MPIQITIILVYLAVVSLVAIIVTAADKGFAKAGSRRVPEATLMLISALGGSVAILVTMLTVRHKTKHIKFMLGIPIIIVLQLCAAAAAYVLLLK